MTNEKENRSVKIDQVETGVSQATGESTTQSVNDGHYHYPGPMEEGYSGNTGRAVQPAGKKDPDVPQNKDTFNYTRNLK
ncbi:hypothetical protein Q8G35_06570 [Peribacillus simplex]|uniref:Uncharacterized protein n=2 Tax=Peribacillus TaxID=2675229 RepID=A0AA90PCR7_9BACI|nr:MULTISPECIES: hypothetical protein [Peribacillus]MDP1418071.1 hypothetical protein [Peribacillus simplex]MDP1450947.1 hypothetical protein [Peribacillus frigoritolerans]